MDFRAANVLLNGRVAVLVEAAVTLFWTGRREKVRGIERMICDDDIFFLFRRRFLSESSFRGVLLSSSLYRINLLDYVCRYLNVEDVAQGAVADQVFNTVFLTKE